MDKENEKIIEFNKWFQDYCFKDLKWHQKLRLKIGFMIDDIRYELWDKRVN